MSSRILQANITVLQYLKQVLISIENDKVLSKAYQIEGPDLQEGCTRRQLLLMIEELEKNQLIMPIDKVARWVGFIQGVMCCRGYISVENERNRTRPIYQEAYKDIT